MSSHSRIITLLRERLTSNNSEYLKYFEDVTDNQVYHKIFHNFRDQDNPKGLHLTRLGYQMMSSCFRTYEVKIADDYKLGSLDLLYLDKRASMPYYIAREEEEEGTRLYMFESKFAIFLKLADGMVKTLREMEP